MNPNGLSHQTWPTIIVNNHQSVDETFCLIRPFYFFSVILPASCYLIFCLPPTAFWVHFILLYDDVLDACRLPSSCLLPAASCLLPPNCCLLPAACCLLPSLPAASLVCAWLVANYSPSPISCELCWLAEAGPRQTSELCSQQPAQD